MGTLTSLQVCMDSSDWLQGTIHEETGMDSSSPSGDMLTCSRPLIERRLRPPHDQALKCPRCDSAHTKFCYYNNYSLSQPRYFCKTCRRYWTKGGTLRNIPVGGGCRKNKKVSSKKLSHDQQHSVNQNPRNSSASQNPTDLQLAFPDAQFSHLTNILGNPSAFMDTKYNGMLENPRAINFMETKYETNYDFVENGGTLELGMMGGYGSGPNVHGQFYPHFGMPHDGSTAGNFMDTCHRLTYPNYQGNEDQSISLDVKPNAKLLSLEWQDQGCNPDAGKDTFGYFGSGLGSWTGLMNGYGSSTNNPLV
ncbi:hypothetical protein RJ640_005217 [Escallonia rubra]|uniref:Dof zinc finger protein n=1 Tax=Escallonia rubra TaxID=112253 RepID=A0AA88QD22_9ASTE|nr:hypothetical protein RJ640_005217 [Escallonia rubra]